MNTITGIKEASLSYTKSSGGGSYLCSYDLGLPEGAVFTSYDYEEEVVRYLEGEEAGELSLSLATLQTAVDAHALAPDLEERKLGMKRELKVIKKAKFSENLTIDLGDESMVVDLSDDTQDDLLKADYTRIKYNQDTITWGTSSGSYELSEDDLDALGSQVTAIAGGIHANYGSLNAEINTATSHDDLDAVDMTSGWPV